MRRGAVRVRNRPTLWKRVCNAGHRFLTACPMSFARPVRSARHSLPLIPFRSLLLQEDNRPGKARFGPAGGVGL